MKEKLYHLFIEGEIATMVFIVKRLIEDVNKENLTPKRKSEKISKMNELTNSDYLSHKGKFTLDEKEYLKKRIKEIKQGAFLRFAEVQVGAPYRIVKRDI